MTPRKPASRKNAVSVSYVSGGPRIGPTLLANPDQLVPNSYAMTRPVTTPTPNTTAKIFSQY